MKHLSIILLLFIALNSSAQKDTISGRTSIGFIFAPEYSNAVQLDGQLPKFAYNTGFVINNKLNENFSLESGLIFSVQSYKENITNFYGITVPNIQKVKNTLNDHFLQIPLNIQYSAFSIKHLKCFISAEISFNYLVYSTTITDVYFNNGSTKHNRYIEDMSGTGFNELFKLGGKIGYGLIYDLKNKSSIPNSQFSILIEPAYSYYLAPFSDMVSLTKLNTIGVNCGLFYKIGTDFKRVP
jgi:hypothetical protein